MNVLLKHIIGLAFSNFETVNVQPANQVLAKAKDGFGKEKMKFKLV
jgi:hypothetical protein